MERWAPLDPLNNPFVNEKDDEECDTKLRRNVTRYSALTDDRYKIAQLVLGHPIKHKNTCTTTKLARRSAPDPYFQMRSIDNLQDSDRDAREVI